MEPFLFPPIPLLNRASAKALQDGVRCMVVCPQHPSKTWWPVFASAALEQPVLLPSPAVSTSAPGCDHCYSTYAWVAIAFDFSSVPAPPRFCTCPPSDRATRTPNPDVRTREFAQLHSRLDWHLLSTTQGEDAPYQF